MTPDPLTRIHVNQHIVKRNSKTGAREPALTVKTGRNNHRAHAVEITGPSRVVYSPDKPLDCGARVWIETRSPVLLDDACCQGGSRGRMCSGCPPTAARAVVP